jgi:hypothetical protein
MLHSRRDRELHCSELKIRRLAQRKRSLKYSPIFQRLEDRPLLSSISWNTAVSPNGGSWDVGANWVGGAVPGSGNDVVIDLSAPGTVTLGSNDTNTVNSLSTSASTNITISDDTLSLATTSAIGGNLTLTSGTLTGAGVLTVSGTTTWTGGTMSGTGKTVAVGGLTLGGNASSTNYTESLSGRELDNEGAATLNWDDSTEGGHLVLSGGAVFDNESGASFDILNDLSIVTSGGGGTFLNAGLLAKTGGTNTSAVEATLNDTGVGSVQDASGTLELEGGGALLGTGTVSVSDVLEFNGGTFALASTVPINGAGTVDFDGGTVTDPGPFDVTGATEVSGGTAYLTGMLTSLSPTLTVSSGDLELTGSIPGGTHTFTSIAISGGTVNFSTGAALSAGQLVLTGGTMTGSDTLPVSGTTMWTGGTMSGTGKTVAVGGLTLGGNASSTNYTESLSGRELDNEGAATLNWDDLTEGGHLVLSGGAVFDNEAGASFDILNDVSIVTTGSGGTFINAGTLSKIGGTNTSAVEATLNDTGVGSIQDASGTLELEGGGTLSATGAISVSDVLEFNGGTFTLASTVPITGAGTVDFDGGTVTDPGPFDVTGAIEVSGGTAYLTGMLTSLSPTLTASSGDLELTGSIPGGTHTFTSIAISGGTVNFSTGAALTAAQLVLTGGTLTGSDTLTVSGTTTWTGGTMSGTGKTVAVGGLTLGGNASSTNYTESLSGRELENEGAATLNWDDSTEGGHLVLSGGAVFDNESGASFDILNDVSIVTTGSGGTFINAGTLAKTGGTNTSAVEATLNDTGVGSIQDASGTLELEGGGTLLGTGAVSVSDVLEFNGGTFALASTVPITGAGTVDFDGGTVTDPGPFDATGATEVSGGTAYLTGTLTSLSPALTVSSGDLELTGSIPGATNTFSSIAISGGTVNFSTGAALSAGQLVLTGGTLTGSNTLTVTGTTTWTGGTMSGTGETVAVGGLTLGGNASSTNYTESLSGRELDNGGAATLNWDDSTEGGHLVLSGGAVFDNEAGASFDILSDVSIVTSGSGGTFINAGTLAKTGGTGISDVQATLSNSGEIQAASGFLSLDNLTNYSSTTNTLTGGTYVVVANLKVAGANIVNNAASIVLNGDLAQFVNTSFQNALQNLATNETAGTLTIEGGLSYETAGPFRNAGTLNVGNQSEFTSLGDYTQTSGSTNLSGAASLHSTSFTVSIDGGLLGGTGIVYGSLTNAGQVAPGGIGVAGELIIIGNYTQTAAGSLTVNLNGPNSQAGNSLLAVGATATLAGTLEVDPASAILPNIDATYSVLSFQSESGQFTNVTAQKYPGGWTFSPSYNLTSVVLTANVPITLAAISLTPSPALVPDGLMLPFTATGINNDGSTENLTDQVTWTSTNDATATISDLGVATGVAPGSTTITATFGSIAPASETLVVTQPILQSIMVTRTSPTVPLGISEDFAATGIYSDKSTMPMTDSVTWVSSSTAVAMISNAAGLQGAATTVGQGPTTITATFGGVTGSVLLTVTAPALVSIAVAPTDPSFPEGSTNNVLTAMGTYTDNSTKNIIGMVTWTVSKPIIASINTQGFVSALTLGSTLITASDGDAIPGSATVTVVPPVVDFTVLGQSLSTDFATILSNVNGALQTAEAIPVIGQSLLNNAAISGDFDTFNDLIQALSTIPTQTIDGANLTASVQSTLFNALGPGGDNTLGDTNNLNNGNVQLDDIVVTPGGSNSISIELFLTTTEQTTVGFRFGLGNYLTMSSPPNAIALSVTTDYLLDLTYDAVSGSLTLNNTSLAMQDSSLSATPLAFVVSASAASPTLGNGQLAGILQATVTDKGSSLMAVLGVGLDANLSATATLSGTANVDVNLNLGFGIDVALSPTITSDLTFTLDFDNSSLDPFSPSNFGTFSAPITFPEVTVSFPLGVIGELISDIQDFTKPLQPIIDILTANIPGLDSLGIDVSLISLLVGSTGMHSDQVQTFFDDITAIDSLNINGDTAITLPVISGLQITDPRASTPEAYPYGVLSADPDQQLNNADSGLAQLDSGYFPLFGFPIFTDPADSILPFLLGTAATQQNPPKLFTFDLGLPTIGAGEDIPVGSIPPFIPVLLLDVNVSLGVELSGGYDTLGLMEIAQGIGSVSSDIADGFYLIPSETHLDLSGSIGLEADAYIVSITGGLSLNVDLSLKSPDGGNVELSSFDDDFSLANLFTLSGEIDLGFSINVGLELGFIHVTVFSVNIGPFVIVSFEPPSPQPQSTAPTIYINETNTNETIHVKQITYPDPANPSLTISAIEVDYPEYDEVYPTGEFGPNGFVNPHGSPQYSQFVTRSVPTPIVTPLETLYEQEPIVDPQSIDIEPGVTSYNAAGQPTPVNALLIGGAGDDDLEYDGSGQAVLIGAGGNNTLAGGGNAVSVIEFGNTIDPTVDSPLSPFSGSNVPAWLAALPSVLGQIAPYLGTPTDTTTDDTFSGDGGADFFEGGAGTNNFQESGNNFTLVAQGQVANVVEYTTPTEGDSPGAETSSPGIIEFGSNTDATNVLGLHLIGKNNLTVMPVLDDLGNYLRIEGTATNLDAYGDIQNVSVAAGGGMLEVGDLSPLPSITSVFITEGTASSANNIIFDAPDSGLPSTLTLDAIPVYEVDVASDGPAGGAPPADFDDMTAQESATNANVVFQGLTAADTVRFKMDGGTVDVGDVQFIGSQLIVIDGAGRAASGNPTGITINVTGPYYTQKTPPDLSSYPNPYGVPAGSITNLVIDSSGDSDLQFESPIQMSVSAPYINQIAIHGSIPADVINLHIPVQLGAYGGGFAPSPDGSNEVSLDAPLFEGTLNINVVALRLSPEPTGAWDLTRTTINLSALNALASLVVTGLDYNNFPYSDFTAVGNSGQTYVTVGDGLLSQIQGSVTVNNVQLTIDNSQSTDDDILTMTAAYLTGWTVPSGVTAPSIFWPASLYNTLLIEAGNDENIAVEGTPALQILTDIGTIYGTFEGTSSVTFENTATSSPPDSVYVMAASSDDVLSLAGDYSVYVGQQLNPDGTVTDVAKVDDVESPIIFDYTGTAGPANLVFDASKDTYHIYGLLGLSFPQLLYYPPGGTSLADVFPGDSYGLGIYFNKSNIDVTFDSDISPGSILGGGTTLDIGDAGTDPITYNATPLAGSTQIANKVIIENSMAPITINGNGNTEVLFQQDLYNDFNLYSGVQAHVSVNDADIDVVEDSETFELPELPDVVLTGTSFTGATMGSIDFTDLTGFSYEVTGASASYVTMTVENTPAGFTSVLTMSGTDLTILGITGPLDVYGYLGYVAEGSVTVGNGTLQGIDGAVEIESDTLSVRGFATTIDDQDDGPEPNVLVSDVGGIAETITGLAPASIGVDGGSLLNLYGSAGSTYTVSESDVAFNLDAGAGSTVNLYTSYPYDIESLTVIGASQVNVSQGDLRYFDDDTIEDDPSDPDALIDVTINASDDTGNWSFVLGDGPSGFNSFVWDRANSGDQTLNLQQNTVQLTLELPTSGDNYPGLTVDDTGLLQTTIDQGNEATTVAGTTGPLLLESNDPAAITIGNAGSVQGINGQVDVVTSNPGQTAASVVVDDSADTARRSVSLESVAGGTYAITGLAPAPIEFTAARYALTLNGSTADNHFIIVDNAAGGGLTVNTGPGDNTVLVFVSGTGGFVPLTINGGAGDDSLAVAGDGDNPVVSDVPTADQPGAGKVLASYLPSGPTRVVNYTKIDSILGLTPPTLYTVTDNSGTVTDPGSLPYMVAQANANTNPAGSEIEFDPSVFSPSDPLTIDLTAPLELTETAGPETIGGAGAGVVIDSFVGQSPVFDVTQGNATITGITLTTSTDAPTILVAGGSLTLRDDVVQESTGFTDAAISLTNGVLDLGTATSAGGNVLNVNGQGEFVHNTTGNSVAAAGDTFRVNGSVISEPYLSFTALFTSGASAVYGQSITLTATIRPNTPSTGTLVGSVDFVDTTTDTNLGPVSVVNGTASLVTSALGAGDHVIKAFYGGGGNFTLSLDSLTEVISKAHLTVTTTLTTTDIGHGGTVPTATVSFSGFKNGDTAAVVSGSAGFTGLPTTSSPAGVYTVTPTTTGLSAANYNFTSVVSAALNVHPVVTNVLVEWGSESMSIVNLNRDLPFSDITGFKVTYSDPVNISGTGLSLTSTIGGPKYAPAKSGAGQGVTTETWTLPTAIGIDRLMLALDQAHTVAATAPALTLFGLSSQAFSILPGDFNGDGVVSSADMTDINNATVGAYDIWADLNGDGVVDINDVKVARSKIGTSLPPLN